MDFDTLERKVAGQASADLHPAALKFSLRFYKRLDRNPYYQTDVADCLFLAREIQGLATICKAENELMKSLTEFRASVDKAAAFKDAVNRLEKYFGKVDELEKLVATMKKKPVRKKKQARKKAA